MPRVVFTPSGLDGEVASGTSVLQAARKAAYDVPWSHAVLRTLELTDYAELDRHRPGWIARRIGISRDEEERCLATLAAQGLRLGDVGVSVTVEQCEC